MIISHKFKFIFIKTAKTAGTSIEVFLSQVCGDNDVVTPIIPHVEPHVARNYKGFKNHMPAKKIRKKVSNNIWNNYFKFCVERNPWDKTLSHYHMINERQGGNLTLDDYFNRGKFCTNYPKYTDASGNIMVDRVIKYESLTEELAEVFEKLSIPFEGSLGVQAKSFYRKDRRPYQQIFSKWQKEKVEEIFAKEIQLHT